MTTPGKSKNPYDIEDDDFDDKPMPTQSQKVELNNKYKEDEVIEKINHNKDDPRIANKISENELKAHQAKEDESFCKKCVCSIF